ncbi:S-adenosyl-L-methionine-dependent methyltransferase [Artomyces pyxidatus]|uniref:S-adenosyl-L-methionine-dependent methyltransferase n=1 Tax=Artomyces pyxidatus TaxID=48021 RepID=A0ACB8T4D4_9AGAM|nr:S-adenosyl-L-methionine-dependent methyltransferase [Artomyces pyxidatus]
MPLARLAARLAAAIGAQPARQELKWMKQARAADPTLPALPAMLTRRVAGEPLAYILGAQPFGPLTLRARAPVLIPRPETEDWALRLAHTLAPSPGMPARRILDLCTGSACIPLLLCALWPPGTARALAVDVAPAALALAADNARLTHTPTLAENPAANTLDVLHGDLRHPGALARALRAHGPFDVLTANPPYLSKADWAHLDPSIAALHEDPAALRGDDDDGLGLYRRIAELVALPGVLAPGGADVALEVGWTQAAAVRDMLARAAGFARVEVWADPWGRERVVVGRRRA